MPDESEELEQFLASRTVGFQYGYFYWHPAGPFGDDAEEPFTEAEVDIYLRLIGEVNSARHERMHTAWLNS